METVMLKGDQSFILNDVVPGQALVVLITQPFINGADLTLEFKSQLPSKSFNYSFDASNKQVKRLKASGFDDDTKTHDWGGWPFSETVSTSTIRLDFELTRDASSQIWAVSINQKRTPWFDYPADADPIQQINVSGGFTKAEVEVDRIDCNDRTCGKGECKECWINEQVVQVQHCSSIETYGVCTRESSACCTGQPMAIDWDTAVQGDWVEVAEDQDLVTQSCQAFTYANADGDSCAGLAGHKGRILAKFDNKMLEMWFPHKLPAIKPILMPTFAMFKGSATWKEVTVDHRSPPGFKVGPSWDASEGMLIRTAEGQAVQLGLTVGWFVHSIGGNPASAYTLERWMSSGEDFKVVVTDLPQPSGQCSDEPNWRDADGDTCAKYKESAWCNPDGSTTGSWKGIRKWWWLLSGSFDIKDKATAGVSARHACCVCGGGRLGTVAIPTERPTLPATTTTSTTQLVTPSPGQAPTAPPGLHQEIYVGGADDPDAQPKCMGLYTLDTSITTHDARIRPGIYRTQLGYYLYWNQHDSAWFMGADYELQDPKVFQAKDTNRQADALWVNFSAPSGISTFEFWVQTKRRSGALYWKTYSLSFRAGQACSSYSPCSCPAKTSHDCKPTLDTSVCTGETCVEKACCEELQYCGDTVQCGVGHIKNTSYLCDVYGCNSTQCCSPQCLLMNCAQFQMDLDQAKSEELCPGRDCTPDFCCVATTTTTTTLEVTTTPPITTTRQPDIVKCPDCPSKGDGSESQAVIWNMTLGNIDMAKMQASPVTRTRISERMKEVIRDKARPGVPISLTTNDIVIQHEYDAGYTKVIVVPPDQIVSQVYQLRDYIQTNTDWVTKLQSMLNADPIGDVLEDGQTQLEIRNISLAEYAFVTSGNLGQSTEVRTWFSFALGEAEKMFHQFMAYIQKEWMLVAIPFGCILVCGIILAMWLNHDNRGEEADVLG
jgi:hypothetical protein